MAVMKYIIAETQEGFRVPFIFPSCIIHSVFAKTLGEGYKAVSAGEVSCDTDYMSVGGQSTSLGLKSSADDKHIIKREIGF